MTLRQPLPSEAAADGELVVVDETCRSFLPLRRQLAGGVFKGCERNGRACEMKSGPSVLFIGDA